MPPLLDLGKNLLAEECVTCIPYHKQLYSSHLTHQYITDKEEPSQATMCGTFGGTVGCFRFVDPTDSACKSLTRLSISTSCLIVQQDSSTARVLLDTESCHSHLSSTVS